MVLATTFDQWQKDVFFSAAEVVQESADILESIYRMYIRDRSSGFNSETSDELRREIHTALGTAKWQLEEFERAVNLSMVNCPLGENTVTRRRQFISAIENQISHTEKALNVSLIEEGKQPFCWVQLNEEEREDLVVFLSAAPEILREITNKNADNRSSTESRTISDSARGFKDSVTIHKHANYGVEVAGKEHCRSKNDVCIQGQRLNGQRRILSTTDTGDWKIEMAHEEDTDTTLVEVKPETSNHASSLFGIPRSVESTTKLRWFKNNFCKAKAKENLELRQGLSNYLNFRGITQFAQGINGFTERSRSCFSSCKEDSKASSVWQLAGRVNVLQWHAQGSQYHLQFCRSLRMILFLVLSIVLIGHFSVFSSQNTRIFFLLKYKGFM